MVDSGNISTWTPAVIAPSGTAGTVYPWQGCNSQWRGTPGYIEGYGGVSQINLPQITQYNVPSGYTPEAWTDDTSPSGNLTVMPFDANGVVAIAGDAGLQGIGLPITNLIPNPSFETGVTNWSAGNLGSGTLTQSSTQARSGNYSAQVTASAVADSFISCAAVSGLTPGSQVTASAYVWIVPGGTTNSADRAMLLTNIASNAGLNPPGVHLSSLPTGSWQRVSVTGTIQSDGGFKLRLYGWEGTVYWDDVMVTVGNQVYSYFDGGYADLPGYTTSWLGASGASQSTATPHNLFTLYASATYSVNCSAQCPGWSSALGSLARYMLVTNSVTGLTGATTTYSTPITQNGPLSWTFTVPAGTVAAYLAVEVLTGSPEDVVTFSKPSVRQMPNLSALGYLNSANAVPLRVAQIQMPTYYLNAGYPAAADYLMRNGGTMTFEPSAAAGSGMPAVVDPRSVTTAADLRYLAAYDYSQASGSWTPWYSSGVHSVNWNANSIAGVAPYYASSVDNDAFYYQLSSTQNLAIPSLLFDADLGTFMYSDDLNTAGITEYTVIMVCSLLNPFIPNAGIWSNIPTAVGGGPDTTADLSTFNYVALDSAGPTLQINAQGMSQKTVSLGNSATRHHPSYLAFTVSDTSIQTYFATTPGSVQTQVMTITGLSGAISGTMVLGADGTNGLDSGSFYLFEMGIYFSALTSQQVSREIQLLGQCYG